MVCAQRRLLAAPQPPHLPPQIVAIATARREFGLGAGDFGRETQRLGLQRIDLGDQRLVAPRVRPKRSVNTGVAEVFRVFLSNVPMTAFIHWVDLGLIFW